MNDDDPEDIADNKFPLYMADKPKIGSVTDLVQKRVRGMEPQELYSAAFVLLGLQRLPTETRGLAATCTFKETFSLGNYRWASIEFSDEGFRLSVGQHFYDPSIGGDTESETVFEACAGGGRAGDIDAWLDTANSIAENSRSLTFEVLSDGDDLDWEVDSSTEWEA